MRHCALALLIAGCGVATEPPGVSSKPRGLDNRVSSSTSAVATEEAEAAEEEEEEDPAPPAQAVLLEDEAEGEENPDEPGVAEGQEEAPAEPEGPPERDLGAELQGAIGSPIGCLAAREAGEGPAEIRISVTVAVTAVGMVTRAEASSAQLSEAEITCIRQRAQNARLRAPIDDAPRSVSTTITLGRKQ